MKHNTTQHNTTQHNTTQHNTTQHNTTQHIPVVFAFDNNYIIPAYVAILSLLMNAKKETYYEIYILEDEEFLEKNKFYLLDLEKRYNTKINYVKLDYQFDDVSIDSTYITKSTYYRLLIPELLRHLDKVIYLDVDLVVNDDLSELYNTNIDNYYIAGVKDIFMYTTHKDYIENILKINKDDYINAGVLLMNLEEIREHNLVSQLLKESYKKYKYSDQCILNKVCNGKVLNIDYKYNTNYNHLCLLSNYNEEFNQMLFNPIIFHYMGADKPWIKFFGNDIMQAFFLYYYKKSYFYQQEKLSLDINISKNYIDLIGAINHIKHYTDELKYYKEKTSKVNNLVQKLSWWIPLKKFRDKFREKFII